MALRWLSAVAALAAAAAPAGAQQVRELGIQAIGTLADPALAVGGFYLGWRPATPLADGLRAQWSWVAGRVPAP